MKGNYSVAQLVNLGWMLDVFTYASLLLR